MNQKDIDAALEDADMEPTGMNDAEETILYLRSENERHHEDAMRWCRMYAACARREQGLLRIKETAEKFVEVFNKSNAWVENMDIGDGWLLGDLATALKDYREQNYESND